jgi:hypothetical protein
MLVYVAFVLVAWPYLALRFVRQPSSRLVSL